MFRTLVMPLLAYVAAAPLTSLISMDVTKTEWGNIWTYVIWAASFSIWSLIGIVGALLAVAVLSDR